MSCHGALNQCTFAAAKAGGFTRGEHTGHAGAHLCIDSQALATAERPAQCAAQHLPQVGVGYQPEPAGQAVAGHGFFGVLAFAQPHCLHLRGALNFQHMAAGPQLRVKQREGLQSLGRPARQLRCKASERAPRRLLRHAHHGGTRFVGGGGSGQQQRACACNDDALAAHVEPCLDEGLQGACTRHTGQRPARKGQQQLAGSGAQDDAVAVLRPAPVCVFQQQGRGLVAGLGITQAHHAGARQQADVGVPGQRRAVLLRQGGQDHLGAVAPDLPTGLRVVVHDGDRCPAGRGSEGSRQTCGARADDEDVAALVRRVLLGHGWGHGLVHGVALPGAVPTSV
ncbi:hypothetical protein D3C71_906150 [compost metagenome]